MEGPDAIVNAAFDRVSLRDALERLAEAADCHIRVSRRVESNPFLLTARFKEKSILQILAEIAERGDVFI